MNFGRLTITRNKALELIGFLHPNIVWNGRGNTPGIFMVEALIDVYTISLEISIAHDVANFV